jgi:hypothetical protein
MTASASPRFRDPLGVLLLAVLLWGYSIPPGEQYVNVDYGYALVLPAGLTAECDDPPRPNHGFAVRSQGLAAAQVWLTADYDAQLLETLDAVVANYAAELADGAPVANRATTLAGLPARRLTLAKGTSIEEVVLALRPQPDGVAIIYTIGLICSNEACKPARDAVEQLRRAVVLRPIS